MSDFFEELKAVTLEQVDERISLLERKRQEVLGPIEADLRQLRELRKVVTARDGAAIKPDSSSRSGDSSHVDRVIELLREQGPMSLTDISKSLGIKYHQAHYTVVMGAAKSRFISVDDRRHGLAGLHQPTLPTTESTPASSAVFAQPKVTGAVALRDAIRAAFQKYGRMTLKKLSDRVYRGEDSVLAVLKDNPGWFHDCGNGEYELKEKAK